MMVFQRLWALMLKQTLSHFTAPTHTHTSCPTKLITQFQRERKQQTKLGNTALTIRERDREHKTIVLYCKSATKTFAIAAASVSVSASSTFVVHSDEKLAHKSAHFKSTYFIL